MQVARSGTTIVKFESNKLCWQDVDGEKCQLTENDREILSVVSHLLGLKMEDVVHVALLRQINVRGNITEIPLKLPEV